jgi:hypothetical protein
MTASGREGVRARKIFPQHEGEDKKGQKKPKKTKTKRERGSVRARSFLNIERGNGEDGEEGVEGGGGGMGEMERVKGERTLPHSSLVYTNTHTNTSKPTLPPLPPLHPITTHFPPPSSPTHRSTLARFEMLWRVDDEPMLGGRGGDRVGRMGLGGE